MTDQMAPGINASPMGSALDQLGISWADVLGMVVAMTAVVVTVLAVFMAFLLSRNYFKSVKEIEELRSESGKLSSQVNEMSAFNSSLLREAMLAVRVLFDLIMVTERRNEYEHLLIMLLTKQEWKGSQVSEAMVEVYRGRVSNEIERVKSAIAARQTELYWLVGQDTEKAAHLTELETSTGDSVTLQLLRGIRECRKRFYSEEENEALIIAIGGIRNRLRSSGNSIPE